MRILEASHKKNRDETTPAAVTEAISTSEAPLLPWASCIWLVAFVIWVVGTPFLPRISSWAIGVAPRGDLVQVLGNVLLYVPLTFVVVRHLGRRVKDRRHVALIGLSLVGVCLSVEAGQSFIRGRVVSVYDVLLNAGGASLALGAGLRAARASRGKRVLVDRAAVSMLGLIYIGSAVYLVTNIPEARGGFRLSGWRDDFAVRVGNEIGADRKYIGTIKEARICAAERDTDAFCLEDGAGPTRRRQLVRLAERNQIVWATAEIVSNSSRQVGPTRIITFSRGALVRNFTLAQSGDDLVLRVRMPLSGLNGTDFIFRLSDAIPAYEEVQVQARYQREKVTLSAIGSGYRRTAVFHLTPKWLWTWLITGEIDFDHEMQRFVAALVGGVLLIFPPAVFAAFMGARRGRVCALIAGGAAGSIVYALFNVGMSNSIEVWPTIGAGAAGAMASTLMLISDRRVWRYTHRSKESTTESVVDQV